MSNLELIKQLAKGVGIYKKQFFLFCAILIVILGFSGLRNYSNYLSADPLEDTQNEVKVEPMTINLNIASDGRIFRDGHVIANAELGDKYDVIKYKILDKTGIYIDSLKVIARFEFPIDKPDITYNVIAAHTDNGFDITTRSTITDKNTIVYTGNYLGPNSTFTIYARLPKGVITPPWWRTSAFDLTSLSVTAWILIGLIIPIGTLVFLMIMIFERWSYSRLDPNLIITNPPEDLPPAVVGVLMSGRISQREIASTIVDLAERGYLYIFQGKGNFNFGRGHAIESDEIYNLKPFEKILLSKIFDTISATNTLKAMDEKASESMFSPKMAQVFLEIYNQASSLGYFQQNPGVTHQKYKISGMILFSLSTIGFILNTLFNKTFPFLIFFWIGMMVSSALIIFFSSRMPVLSPKGKAARQAWLSFKNYLSKTDTINFKETQQSPYSKYLAHAIALSSEVNWTKHFYDVPFVRPKWFDSDPSTQTIEDFANTLFPLVAFVGHNMIATRTPVVD